MFKKKNIVKVKSFKIEFNHDAKTIAEALNLSEEERVETLANVSLGILVSSKVSEVIEFLCRNLRGKQLLWAMFKLGTIAEEVNEVDKTSEDMFR